MTYKKYNPSVEGYMGDFLRGNVGINQLKPQHEFFDAVGLEKALSDNTQYHIVLTLSEAKSIIKDINPFRSPNPYDGEAFTRGIEEENKKKILCRMYFLSQILFLPMPEVSMIYMGSMKFVESLRG
ncbi:MULTISPECIES: hypothetical protein [Photorhabdus]|uniref:hypothetical protein n=1 Tax=Photorhabdus TaxID=29487 RepID=UPI001F6201E9|nr:hypothetical protein [Photorhabdus tasmaniensis]